MKIFPAIDIRGGRAVRLLQGDYDNMTVYAADPAAVARDFASRGARYLHVVDLDGAAEGRPVHLEAVAAICAVPGLFVELGGGIRDADAVARCLFLGVGRVILGSAALGDPDFLRAMLARYGSAIAVGVDARDGMVAIHGWKETTRRPALDFCRTLWEDGVETIIYTDISRDGMMRGVNLEVYRALRAHIKKEIVASGGVSTLADLAALRGLGVDAAIVGKALYEGAFDLTEAIAAAEQEAAPC